MNIAIDVRKLEDYGIGTHIKNVILHAIRREPHHHFFLFCDPLQERNEERNILWIPEKSSKYSIKEHFSLAAQAEAHGVQIFHSPHYTLPLRLRCKSIVTIHDLIHFKFPGFFPLWKRKAAEYVIKKAVSKADLILTVSNTSKEDLLSFVPAARNKVEVLYNKLSDVWSLPPAEIDLRSLGIEEDFILYAGNFKKHKSVPTLLEAYRRIGDAPQLILVGSKSSIDDSLLEMIFSIPRVRLLGFAETRLLQKLYSRAMLFVFPSLYEGFGYPPLEAMACGAPVLSSDAPALKEVLSEGAEYFERGNVDDLIGQIAFLLQNSSRRDELSQKGRARAKSFMKEDSPERLLEIYRSFE